jgi:hypothetical protein
MDDESTTLSDDEIGSAGDDPAAPAAADSDGDDTDTTDGDTDDSDSSDSDGDDTDSDDA